MAPKTLDVTIRGNDESKKAFDSAHKNAEDFGSKLKDTVLKPFELIKAFLAYELTKVVGEFFKSSVEAAAESRSRVVARRAGRGTPASRSSASAAN
jgi:hypothetical protein